MQKKKKKVIIIQSSPVFVTIFFITLLSQFFRMRDPKWGRDVPPYWRHTYPRGSRCYRRWDKRISRFQRGRNFVEHRRVPGNEWMLLDGYGNLGPRMYDFELLFFLNRTFILSLGKNGVLNFSAFKIFENDSMETLNTKNSEDKSTDCFVLSDVMKASKDQQTVFKLLKSLLFLILYKTTDSVFIRWATESQKRPLLIQK